MWTVPRAALSAAPRAFAVRAFSSTTCACVSNRSKRLQKRKTDDDLRHAVSLYHLTPSFYPIAQGADSAELDTAVTESVLGPFFGERDGRPFVQFATTSELLSQQRQDVSSGRKDTLGELDMYDTSRIQHTFAPADLGATRTAAPPTTESPTHLRQHFVKQPNAYPSRRARDTAGHGEMYSHEEMSMRSAQVRDALFGTVCGELPGLEIVREHERKWDQEK